jgi:hypothetical protein
MALQELPADWHTSFRAAISSLYLSMGRPLHVSEKQQVFYNWYQNREDFNHPDQIILING